MKSTNELKAESSLLDVMKANASIKLGDALLKGDTASLFIEIHCFDEEGESRIFCRRNLTQEGLNQALMDAQEINKG